MRPAAEADAESRVSARAFVAVISAGIFVTGFGWPGIIGRIPFTLLLKNQLGLGADKVAGFWAVATFAWYCKPLVGLICDAYPFAGTRRRGYMLWGAVLAGVCWLGFAVVPRRYGPFMALMTALNVALVFVSTVVGGLQVEASQRMGATGRLASLRSAIEGSMYLLSGPIGGVLAVLAFGWTSMTGALILLSFVPVVARFYPEQRGARATRAVWTTARAQLGAIVRSRPMWGTAGLTFLFYLAPGFQTPLLYVQQDVLKLDPRVMGLLVALSGVGWMVGAALYAFLCRRFALRTLLVVGIAINALGTLMYLRYDSAVAAMVIETVFGVLYTLAALPLNDLLARATPKGSESFGFGLVMSVRNIAIFAISDVVGSTLYARHHFPLSKLVWVNTLSTLAVLLFVPFLPRVLLAAREGAAPPTSGTEANSQP
jgi:hypothetical protein